MTLRRFHLPVIVVALSIAVGCGSNETSSAAGEPSPAAVAQAPAAGSAAAAITDADLAAYERGIRKEIEAVRAAQQAAASATTAQERAQAAQAQWEDATMPQGAAASGLGEERYRAVRTAVHDVLRTLDFQGKIDGPLSIDLERADEATKARVAGDAFAGLPTDSAAVLRPAIPRLTPAWVEYMTLTAVAG
jgi:hypothetical protein